MRTALCLRRAQLLRLRISAGWQLASWSAVVRNSLAGSARSPDGCGACVRRKAAQQDTHAVPALRPALVPHPEEQVLVVRLPGRHDPQMCVRGLDAAGGGTQAALGVLVGKRSSGCSVPRDVPCMEVLPAAAQHVNARRARRHLIESSSCVSAYIVTLLRLTALGRLRLRRPVGPEGHPQEDDRHRAHALPQGDAAPLQERVPGGCAAPGAVRLSARGAVLLPHDWQRVRRLCRTAPARR